MSSPVKRNRSRPGPKKNFKPEMVQMNNIHACRKALRELVKTGGISDPDVIARIEAGWNPAVELAVLSVKPDLPDPVKTVVLKILLENVSISATDKARLEAGESTPTSINISIASWAAGQGPRAEPIAIEHRADAPEIDYTQGDRAEMHRTSPPTEPAYQEYEMRRDGSGVERPFPVEEPVQSDGWKPHPYAFNERTGSYDIVNDDGN